MVSAAAVFTEAARAVGFFNCTFSLVARDKEKQQQCSELVVCTHLAAGTSCRCLCHSGSSCKHTYSGRVREVSKAGVNSRSTGSARVLAVSLYSCGYWVLL